MFHELKALVGRPVSATDGEIGHIRTFLFDDQSWKVRYLVVDVGRWLGGREVVLPTESLGRADFTIRTCHVRLTKEQVRNSPDIDSEKPVSRQQDIAMAEYYGSFAWWIDTEYGLPSLPAYRKFPVGSQEDPHLRSTSHLLGYEVLIPDEGKARLEGFVLDEDQWHLNYLDVKTGNWLNNRSMLIPTQWVDRVLWATRQIFLHKAAQPAATDRGHLADAG